LTWIWNVQGMDITDDKKVHNGQYVSSGIAWYIKVIFSTRTWVVQGPSSCS
jgi:hypothetical protein